MEISDDIQLGTRITLQVSEGGCDDCFFAKLDYDLRVDCCYRIKCHAMSRKDKKNVAFKLVKSSANEPNKPIEPKYSFKPFDKVLVRDSDDEKWSGDFFNYMEDGQAICTGTYWLQCLPYNEDTAKLVGTTKSLEDIR